jgi:hypothetical protein
VKLLLPLLAALTALGLTVASASSLGVSSQQLASGQKLVSHGTCTLRATADTTIDRSNRSANYGSATQLGVSAANNAQLYAFVRFNPSTCSFPSGYVLDSARLVLSVTTPPAGTRTFKLWRAGGSWSESTLTWNNQPAVGASVTSATIAPSSSSTTFFVTDEAIAILGGTTNNGWQIRDSATANDGAGYSSDEGSAPPTLVLDYAY